MDTIPVFVHVSHVDGPENFHTSVRYIPHKSDRFSIDANGPVYEVDYTLFNCFSCDYEVEIYCHEIS